jgi:predicted nucleotidyltransferase
MQVSTRDDVVSKIKANRRALKRYSVRSLALFGSAARNKLRKSSDIDVLVQFDKTTWANYIGLKFYLEDLLGRKWIWLRQKRSNLLQNHPLKKTCFMSSRNANLYLQMFHR